MKSIIVILLLAFQSAASLAQGSTDSCKDYLDGAHQENGAPFSVVDKTEAIWTVEELSELEDQETAFIVTLLKQTDTEAYSAFDSSDAGYHLLIVNKACEELWSGFVFHH